MSNTIFSLCVITITIAIATAAVTIPTAPVVRQSRPILQSPPQSVQQPKIKQQQPQQLLQQSQSVAGAVRLQNVQPKPQSPPTQPESQPEEESEPSSPEEILDVYFDFIKNNDENNCLMRLICQIGYNRTAFGNFGEQIAGFFTEIESNTGAAAQYRTAFQTHMTEPNVAKCVEKYPNCQYETHDMIEVGNDLMNRNLTNLQLDDVKKGPTWIAQAN